jgi:hypothetical protein
MSNEPSDNKRLMLIAFGAVWLMAFIYAFVASANTHFEWQPLIYLGWQGIAGMVAVAVYAIGRVWEKGTTIRRMSRVPLLLAGLHVIALLGIWTWARI